MQKLRRQMSQHMYFDLTLVDSCTQEIVHTSLANQLHKSSRLDLKIQIACSWSKESPFQVSNKSTLLVTKGIATRSKDATRGASGLTRNKKLLVARSYLLNLGITLGLWSSVLPEQSLFRGRAKRMQRSFPSTFSLNPSSRNERAHSLLGNRNTSKCRFKFRQQTPFNKLVVTSASLLVTSALLLGTRSY